MKKMKDWLTSYYLTINCKMKLVIQFKYPKKFCTYLYVFGVRMTCIALNWSGTTSMPVFLITNPNNFSNSTLNMHLMNST